MKDFLLKIQEQDRFGYYHSFSGTWANGAKGAIILNEDSFVTFEEYTQDLTSSAVDDEGKPLEHIRLNNVKKGFITWLLHSIQHGNVDYNKFYTDCRDYYVSLKKNSPDFWKWQNNIDGYFLEIHYKAMKEQLTDIPLYEYLDGNDVKQIKEYCNNYLEWLESKMPAPVKHTCSNCTDRDKIHTERAVTAFNNAIENGYMEETNNGYKWLKTKVQLAYFIRRIYNADERGSIPYKVLEKLFEEKSLSVAVDHMWGAKKPQRWRCLIDDLIE